MLQDRRPSQDWKVARVLGGNQGRIVPGRGNSEYTVAEDRTIGRPVSVTVMVQPVATERYSCSSQRQGWPQRYRPHKQPWVWGCRAAYVESISDRAIPPKRLL